MVLTVLYALLCANNPSTHPFITEAERNYLQKEIGGAKSETRRAPTPWNSILTSVPVIALVTAGCLGDFGYFVAMIDLPKYMNDVLHMNAQENGIYSSLPYVAYILLSLVSSFCSDRLIASGRISITNARKLFVILCEQLISINFFTQIF